jgi:hypothetical protein
MSAYAGCLLISFSTPVTFYCYHRMVQGFDNSKYDNWLPQ